MPYMGKIGYLGEVSEMQVNWDIDFMALSDEVDSFYESPMFSLSDSCWCLRMYSNGQTSNETSGWIGLHLIRLDSGPQKARQLSLGVKKHDELHWRPFEKFNTAKNCRSGSAKFFLRSDLLARKSEFMPSNILTLTCRLKNDILQSNEVCLFMRLWDLSCDMKKILVAGERTDFVVNLNGHELRAHKMILEKRCEYFSDMFRRNLQEDATGVGDIDDIEEGVFKSVLSYIYSGEAEGMSEQNVCKIYVAADKLLLKMLKDLCIEYMKRSLSPNLVPGVMAIAEKYDEENLSELARDYFSTNASEVVKTEEWKTFREENAVFASEVLESFISKRNEIPVQLCSTDHCSKRRRPNLNFECRNEVHTADRMHHNGVTGKLTETSGYTHVVWLIPNIFSSTAEMDSFYESPVFSLSDSCWCLRMYVNGEAKKDTSGWIGLYVIRMDSGPPKSVEITLTNKKCDGLNSMSLPEVRMTKHSKRGSPKFLLRSELLANKPQFMPKDNLTVSCKLNSVIPISTEVCMFTRLWDVSRDMKEILDAGKRTDFVVNLNGCEVRAHKMILERRCNYFACMLRRNLQENTTGVGDVDDIEEGVFRCILSYMYSGEAEGMSEQNVCKIYVAADKLLLKKLKELCSQFMKGILSPNLVSEVIAIAEKYGDPRLNAEARDYLSQNAAEVFQTEEWRKLKEKNAALSSELLQNIILSKVKSS